MNLITKQTLFYKPSNFHDYSYVIHFFTISQIFYQRCLKKVRSILHTSKTSPTIESWETIVREEIDSLKQIYDKDLTEKSSANDAPIISIFVPADYSATSLTSGNLIISYLPNYPQTMYFTFSFLSYANITTL